MEKYLLPIGSIVELKDIEAKIMISGYCPEGELRPGYVWDYSGFLFPIGYRSAQEIIQFDHNQIRKIVAMGYQDEEQFRFSEIVGTKMDTVKTENGQA